jgi:hypothetical protein
LKKITGFGEAKTVKVVENGEGGPKRVFGKPATRHGSSGGLASSGAGFSQRTCREVDSPGWARRRGEQLHGRRFARHRVVFVTARWYADEDADGILEGEGKAMSGTAWEG